MKKFPCQKICRNGEFGCSTDDPKTCVRFFPLEGANLTKIEGIVETPAHIDYDTFSQYFMNWIESMGWFFGGGIDAYEGDEE